MPPNRKLVSKSSKSKSELGTVSRLLTKIGKTDSKSLAWPIARPNGPNARLVYKKPSNQFLKVPLAEPSIPVKKLPKKKKNYEIQQNKGDFFHILMYNKNLGQAIDTKKTRATVTMDDIDNVYLKYTDPRVIHSYPVKTVRKSSVIEPYTNQFIRRSHKSPYPPRLSVPSRKSKPMFTFGPDDLVDERSRTPATIIEAYKLPMAQRAEMKSTGPNMALSTSINTMLNEISIPRVKDQVDIMPESNKEKPSKSVKKNHLSKKKESKHRSGKVKKNQRLSEESKQENKVNIGHKHQHPKKGIEENTSNDSFVERESQISEEDTSANNVKKKHRGNKDAKKTLLVEKKANENEKEKEPMTEIDENINEKRFSSKETVRSLGERKSRRSKKYVRVKHSVNSADFRDMARLHKRRNFRRSRLQDVVTFLKQNYRRKRKNLGKNTLYATSLLRESVVAGLNSTIRPSITGLSKRRVNSSILRKINRDRIKLGIFYDGLSVHKSKIKFVAPPSGRESGVNCRRTIDEEARSKRQQVNELAKTIRKPQSVHSIPLYDYQYRYNKIKQYIESDLMEMPSIENISIENIDFKQFLYYPYNLQGPEVKEETPKPIKTIRKSQSPAKPIIRKTEEPEPPKPPNKCECHICVAIHRNKPIEDNPLIAKMKEELRRQELKAYIKNKQVFKSDCDRPYDSQYKFTSGGLLPYRKPQQNCFCQYPPLFCKKNSFSAQLEQFLYRI